VENKNENFHDDKKCPLAVFQEESWFQKRILSKQGKFL